VHALRAPVPQAPPAFVPGAECVGDGHHDRLGPCVDSRRQRLAEVDEADPERVGQLHPQAPRLREEQVQRVVDREQRRLERAVDVDLREEAPQLAGRGGRVAGRLDHVERAGRRLVLPVRPEAVEGVAGRAAVELQQGALERCAAVTRELGVAQPPHSPPLRQARQHPRDRATHRLPDRRKRLDRRVLLEEAGRHGLGARPGGEGGAVAV
jgi:hypothetical protein